MKILTPILSLLFLNGCATAIPYRPDETCALNGMKAQGITVGQSSATAYSETFGYSVASGNSNSVRCDVPTTQEDTQKIELVRKAMEPKIAYNSSIGGKRFLTGLGYFLYILPGIGAKMYYDREFSDAVQKSEEIRMSQPQPGAEVRTPAQK